jgi:hypothetical protein
MGIGEILSTAFQFYRQHWRTLLTIASVVVVPVTLIQYLLGDLGWSTGVLSCAGLEAYPGRRSSSPSRITRTRPAARRHRGWCCPGPRERRSR